MRQASKHAAAALAASLLFAPAAGAQDAATPDGLRAWVDALRVADVPWRKIPWQPCLVEGLAAARAQDRPLILWIFIDRPVDDRRC